MADEEAAEARAVFKRHGDDFKGAVAARREGHAEGIKVQATLPSWPH
jgi:hypothetical protein